MTSFMVVGNITKAAETRTVIAKNGAKQFATDFYIAVNDDYGENKITTYYKVTIWGQKGSNLCPYLYEKREVVVSGIPGQEEPWTGKDGQIRAGSMIIRRAQVELRGKNKAENMTVNADVALFDGEEVEE